ncbi:hypothetical protein KIN20_013031 [Parelaphostrongylus tenuis]|uniref:Uncharacterized protein n=1 Tax=Parelaphostrongylus tenuis TaxID=148309 RepID=A0AAD5MWY0_PARTN|nr:hypothetical protein KIN20_013031 [Parelaphostrongylus tenuis]
MNLRVHGEFLLKFGKANEENFLKNANWLEDSKNTVDMSDLGLVDATSHPEQINEMRRCATIDVSFDDDEHHHPSRSITTGVHLDLSRKGFVVVRLQISGACATTDKEVTGTTVARLLFKYSAL